jgi:hypothetical protein
VLRTGFVQFQRLSPLNDDATASFSGLLFKQKNS